MNYISNYVNYLPSLIFKIEYVVYKKRVQCSLRHQNGPNQNFIDINKVSTFFIIGRAKGSLFQHCFIICAYTELLLIHQLFYKRCRNILWNNRAFVIKYNSHSYNHAICFLVWILSCHNFKQ